MPILEFIKAHQLNFMLFMSGICFVLVLLTIVTGALSPKRRRILAALEFASMLLLLFDRMAYIYRGDTSLTGFWMVRITNFMVYLLSLWIPHEITLYLNDLYTNEGKMTVLPKRLKICEILFYMGVALLVISQFTGLYYTFDEQNRYQRASGNIICYIMPLLIVFLQQSVIIQYRNRLSRLMSVLLVLNTIAPVVASIIQLFAYGISLTNMTTVGFAIMIYVFALLDLNRSLKKSQENEIRTIREAQKREHVLFEETAEALASAIDAKDEYTHGHSSRVADYSEQIAREAGMSEEECEKVYFAALLHDVGKIGIDESIINKEGKLTDEEFQQIKMHPVYGNQILSTIQQSPYLSIGAHYHHERYDGKGYPDGLIGDDIPEIARIIAVADSYDAMTSKRSYRDVIPQQKVREELVKGMGTQFDPRYAKIMLHMMDLDLEYKLREEMSGSDPSLKTRLICESIYHECSTGVLLSEKVTKIRLFHRGNKGFPISESLPTLVVFDALDGRIHEDEKNRRELFYFEYARIRFDGNVLCEGARKYEIEILPEAITISDNIDLSGTNFSRYDIEAVRYKDHARIRISDGEKTVQTILALPDNTRFAYLSLTGEHCIISNIQIVQSEETISEGSIRRIAEEISYIKDAPTGDIPNIQVDGWRTASTIGVPIKDETHIRFHTRSLPTARLVWHCPFISVFTSDDGTVKGKGFREFVLIRLDGENWESDAHAENKVIVSQTSQFDGWNRWREANLQGMDCEAVIKREGNVITVTTENIGISIRCITDIKDDIENVYVALTGDQCAITDIRIS